MVSGVDNILSPALGQQLIALQRTAREVDAATIRISTGKRVNSALDNPQNFFTSLSLQSQASDLGRLLDGISQSIRTIQVAENGLRTLEYTIDLAEFTAREAKATLLAEQQNVSDVILEDDPLVYYRLDETSGAIVNNSGTDPTILGQYLGGVTLDTGPLHFSEDSGSVSFDGAASYINIPNNPLINTDPAGYPERTVELTFQANTTAGRQVLFKEGGTGNAFNIYIEDGRIYFVARDAGDFGPFNISEEITEGETYHAAFVFDSNSATFRGYLNGEVVGTGTVTKEMNRHGGAISIGRSSGGSFYHDGPQGGTGNYFNGRISDFALYNDVLTQDQLQNHYAATQLETADNFEQQVNEILQQVDLLVEDASFKGINLLNNDNITTHFDRRNNSLLHTEGVDFTYSGLGIAELDFQTFAQLDVTISELEDVSNRINEFERSLISDLNVIQTRQDYTRNTINTLKAGSDDLTIADQDKEGANMLALAVRQTIQLEVLALSGAAGTNILDIFTSN